MRRFHHPAAYAPGWPPSFWAADAPPPAATAPARGAIEAEVAIIGAGYAGLNAALFLAGTRGMRVVVLDAAQPGWGASGRNGGFCCIGGSKLSLGQIAGRHGAGAARDWHRFETRGIDHVAALLERHRIAARQGPGGEALLAHAPKAWRGLQAEAEAERELTGSAPELIPPGALAERGLAGPGFHGALLGGAGFPLQPMRYVLGLAAAARAAGAGIYGQSPVLSLEPLAGGWKLGLATATVTARRVLIATNGYSSEDLPPWMAGRTVPVFSQLMVTRPLAAAERAAQGFNTPLMAYDSRTLLHYFRHLPDGRFMFGMRGGLSGRPDAEAAMRRTIRSHFARMFPAWADVEITHDWSGLACLTPSLAPYIGKVPGHPGLYAAFGWHGNGVAAASLGGMEAGRLIAGEAADLPDLVRRVPPALRLPGLRRAGLRARYLWHHFADGPLP